MTSGMHPIIILITTTAHSVLLAMAKAATLGEASKGLMFCACDRSERATTETSGRSCMHSMPGARQQPRHCQCSSDVAFNAAIVKLNTHMTQLLRCKELLLER